MKRPHFFCALFAALTLCSMVTAQETSQLEVLLAQARAAKSKPVRCKGSAEFYQAKHEFEFAFDGTGRFALTLFGPMGRTSAFDGNRAWQVDDRAGIPYDLDLFLGDSCRATYSIWTGDWCRPSFGFEVEDPRYTDDGIALTIRSPRSTYTATLEIDKKTMEPRCLTPTGWGTSGKTRFLNFKDGLALRVESEDPVGNMDVFLIEEVEPYSNNADSQCGSKPKATPRNFQFDSKADMSLAVKQAPSGHLLVRTKINGVEIGWFMFDTGAPITTISKAAVEKLGLAEIGRTYIGGAGSDLTAVPMRSAKSLDLGPIRLENPVLTQFDNIGGEAVGVIGWDVLIHSVVEIDMQEATISIRSRDGYELPAGEWQDMTLHMRHPHVQASFAKEHRGLFRIDTGAGRVGVMFHNPTVQRLDMLAGRETSQVRARGAGGEIDLRLGTIEWFEIAGHRTEKPQTLFCMDETGALADGNSLGNLGGGVLTPFVMVFDYQDKRVGFVPRDELR